MGSERESGIVAHSDVGLFLARVPGVPDPKAPALELVLKGERDRGGIEVASLTGR